MDRVTPWQAPGQDKLETAGVRTENCRSPLREQEVGMLEVGVGLELGCTRQVAMARLVSLSAISIMVIWFPANDCVKR